MAENLKVTHYRDGSEIPYPSDEDFGIWDEGQYGIYDNDSTNADIYGNLYNWFVVDDERGVCPEGWNVPSDEEYTILIDYLGGQFVVGGQMKSTGTIESGDGLWYSPNVGATNESGFTGLPPGYRHSIGSYDRMGTYGYFWSSSEYTSSEAWNQKLYYNNFYVTRGYGYKLNGYSIRCLADEITSGCTDPEACNYDELATADDGSCEYCSCQTCSEHGTCVDTGSNYTCTCNGYYSGTNCETDIDECATDNGGCGDATYYTCTNNVGAAPTCSDITTGCTAPEACNYDETANVDDGSCEYYDPEIMCDCDETFLDVNGDCCGYLVMDECGVCNGGYADDLGCGCFEPEPSGCDNVCGSTLENDECGVCGGDGSDDLGCGCFEAGPSGCDNACGSNLEFDECGVCGGDNSSCIDCAGTPNGDAAEDCTGVCNGSSELDDCGVCGGNGSSCIFSVMQSMEQAHYYFEIATLDSIELTSDDWIIATNPESGVLVAAGQYILTNGDVIEVVVMGEEVIWGQYWDEGACDPDFSGPVNTCGMMLSGQTPQFAVYDFSADSIYNANYIAADSTQLQSIPSYIGLGFSVGLSLNLVTDCNGDMGGAASIDACGNCWGGNTGNDAYYVDCAGVCNGYASEDNCGICDANSYNDCIQDCAGVWGGDTIDDECGVCGGEGASCDGTLLVPSEYSTIQSAIDAAVDGYTVLVSAGTYYENINFNGKNIALIGEDRETTIIDGGQNGTVVTINSGENSTAVFNGFTITNGSGSQGYETCQSLGTAATWGGGILIYDSSPQILNCNIINNSAYSGGGIAILHSSTSNIINCKIDNNSSSNNRGGGISLGAWVDYSVDIHITNSQIINNNGSGINVGYCYNQIANISIENSKFVNNYADFEGGAINHGTNAQLDIYNSEFYNNSASNWGGALKMHNSRTTLINCNFVNNTAPEGSAIFVFGNAQSQELTIVNSIIWDNDIATQYGEIFLLDIDYTDIQGGWEGTGNIDADPLFTDPDNGDYTLQSSSHCIDAGDPESDPDPDGTIADMGAYYFEQESNCIDLHEGANLISFSTLPRYGPSDMPECIRGIIGEGVGAAYVDGIWIGSLLEFSCEDGYWVVNYCEDFEWCYNGAECSEETEYALHLGNNLISYTLSDCGSVDEVLPDDVEECIYGIVGEGSAALNTDIGWIGTLTTLCPNDGYWFISECDIDFTYNDPTTLSRRQVLNPSPYPYNQSSKQAFYFIESVENIKAGDWILSYNGDKLIGTRQWQGSVIDVPAMGSDGNDYSDGYMQAGDAPQFKVLRNGKLIDLEGDIPAWSDNGMFMVSSLTQVIVPEVYSLSQAYPNPFNPVTTLSFALPIDTEVSLSIYNLQGRQVTTLIDGNMDAGYHSVVWNADAYSSGVYFVKMIAGEYVNTQKLMLIK